MYTYLDAFILVSFFFNYKKFLNMKKKKKNLKTLF